MKFIAILAGDITQYQRFVRDICKNDSRKFRFVENNQDICGAEFIEIIKIGSYWRNPDNRMLEQLIRIRILKQE